jgi:hypothetical protein
LQALALVVSIGVGVRGIGGVGAGFGIGLAGAVTLCGQTIIIHFLLVEKAV